MGESADNPTEQSPDWFIASCEREGNHYGCLHDGIVHTQCGQQLEPRAALFGHGEPAHVVLPMPQGQACHACCAAASIDPASVEEAVHGYRPAGRTATIVRRPAGFTPLAQQLALLAQQQPPAELPAATAGSDDEQQQQQHGPLPSEPQALVASPSAPARRRWIPQWLNQDLALADDDDAHDAEGKESTRSFWWELSGNPGDTHWIGTSHRGNRVAKCGKRLARGHKVDNPARDRRCPKCESRLANGERQE